MTTLAFEILQWTRANKKNLQALAAALPPDESHGSMPPGAQQACQDGTALLDALLNFERQYRGTAHFLRNPQHPECSQEFRNGLRRTLEHLLERMLQMSRRHGFHVGLLDLQGLELHHFRSFYQQHLAAKLQSLSREDSNIRIYHASTDPWRWNGLREARKGWILELHNGSAMSAYEDFINLELPEGQGEGTLREQQEMLAEGWIKTRETFQTIISNKGFWPTDGQRIDHEKEAIRKLADTFFKSLTDGQTALLRQHPDTFRERFNARFWK